MRAHSLRFRDVLLQEEAVRHLAGSLRRGRIAQTYLFVGNPSVGKGRVALAFAAALQCLEPETGPDGLPDACGRCLSCKRILAGNHPDVTAIQPLGNDIRIDQVRKMQELAMLHPYLGKWRLFFLDPADRLNEYSANSLLKILEEAPERVIFILLARDSGGLLPTIRSRSEMVLFRTPSHHASREALVQFSGKRPEEAARLYSLTEGAFGLALQLAGDAPPIGGDAPPLLLEDASPAGLSLPESQVRFLDNLETLSGNLRERMTQAGSLEAALQSLEVREAGFFFPLQVSRKAFVRGILMAERLPASFPILFTRLFLDRCDHLKRDLKKQAEELMAGQKQAYTPGLLKEMEEQFGGAAGAVSQAQITGLLETLLHWMEDIFHWGFTRDETLLLNLDRKEDIMTLADVRGVSYARETIQMLTQNLDSLRRYIQPSLILESVLTHLSGEH